MTEAATHWESLQSLQCSGEINEKRPVVFLALRTEEFVAKTFSSYGLITQPHELYWAEFDDNGILINHYEYKYDESELKRIACKLLDSEESSEHEKLNARIAISLITFKQEIFSDSPDPWKLAAHASGLATITSTPKQRRGVDSMNARIKGEKGGRRLKRHQALQKVIDGIAEKINSEGGNPSASKVRKYLESFESYSPLHTGNDDCDDLYVDGNSLFWNTRDGTDKSIKLRSLDPYIANAKNSLSNSP